jgi:hypothetical protein
VASADFQTPVLQKCATIPEIGRIDGFIGIIGGSLVPRNGVQQNDTGELIKNDSPHDYTS